MISNKAEADKIKLGLQQKILEGEAKELEAAVNVMVAEMSGSWLQRNWRPLAMINFLVLVNVYWFGWTPANLDPANIGAIFELIKWGLGGYVVGRSGEKIVKAWKEV